MPIDPETLLALVAVATLAGFIDAIAGGGGLLTLPALLWAGLPPVQALATNKLQGTFGSLTATLNFIHKGEIGLGEMAGTVALTFLGSALGTFAVQQIDPGLLRSLLPLLLIAFALYFLFSPRVGDRDAHRRIGVPLFGLTAGFGIGFYDGFFGPGTGSFFALAFVALLGFNLRKATAHAKLLNFASNLASLLAFIAGGKLIWFLGLAMAGGQFVGAWTGSHLVLRQGTALIRPMLVAVSLAMAVRLLLG
ncbi:MAG: hypothetical protein A2286_01250 [Gammaproteobacteria bacterium RIFOXYA12_FULL_61_12]|nr:MAG: hypothetical protein A2514_08350 [Gammaproteobacteria bacterium RIFOXYD12_FULL_61_37]OGT90209.1 MAG: hypothetical protein A2286_01250 [Gammaproteobacteria bacterium RIFOXYA12_FULL_61_12]